MFKKVRYYNNNKNPTCESPALKFALFSLLYLAYTYLHIVSACMITLLEESASCLVKVDGKGTQGRILLSFFVLYPDFY